MALEIKQTVRLSQNLVITPQLQQAIKLLQLSQVELADLIQKELLENPVLEEQTDGPDGEAQDLQASPEETIEGGENQEASTLPEAGQVEEVGNAQSEFQEPKDFDWENYVNTFSASTQYVEREIDPHSEQFSYENILRQGESLHDHLLWQLHMGKSDELELQIATEIIGNINEDGYFIGSLEEISQKFELRPTQIEDVLKKIQQFDPLGVGSRNLQECLLTQIQSYEEPLRNQLHVLITDHLSDLERHDFAHIAKKMGLNTARVQELALFVSHLEPKPGRPFSTEQPQYITPDVYINKVGEEFVVTLNEEGLPRLQISDFYRRSLMKGNTDVAGKTKDYIQDRLRAATWLIKSIHQRQRTLYKVTKSIIKFQRDFFDQGIEQLKPLVLKEVADDIEMHESTVSRVTTNKYVYSPRGIFELKFFFNSGVHQLEGGGVASEAVKSRIKALVDTETNTKPLSDQDIAEELKKFNIDIARRTVAKYREAMGILPSSKRRYRI